MTTPGYAARAAKYARDVAAGRVVAGKLTRLACQRHLNDLARWKAKDAPFHFDPDKAEHVCKFVELLPHIKGKWAGKRIVLEPWQIFILAVAFGWRRRSDGLRRFRAIYIEVARKNAKSTLTAAIGLYMLAADGEAGAEILAAATSQDQARIVFADAQEMVRKSPGLQRHYGVKVTAHSIWVAATASKFIPVSAEANSLEGKNAHLAIIDELHAHKTPAVHNVLEQSMGARTQPMLWRITTAGSNQAGICYQQRGYLVQVLEGAVTDETVFGIIYTLDGPNPATKFAGDDWTDPMVWVKANPNLGVSVFEDDLARLCEKAKRVSSQQADFQTKRLNVWVGAAAPWMNMRAWALCVSPDAQLERFAGHGCYVGIDLAHKIDVAAVARLFVDWIPPTDEAIEAAAREGKPAPAPKPLYTAFVRFYLPEGIVEEHAETSHAHFKGWSLDGHVVLTPGNTTDFDMIRDDLKADAAETPVIEGGYDPAQAWSFAPKLREEDGINMVEVAPTVLNFSEPMKELESVILDGRFQHDGNPVLTWMVSNVTVFRDRKDNVFPRKERDENKIDGVVALLMAFARAMMAIPNVSVYETRDPIVFG